MRILKANTAVRLVVGPLCDKTTGLAKTGMTVTNMWHEHDDGSAPTKSIDAVSFTASAGNNDMVELAGGYYDIEITAAQLNITAGRCQFCIYDDDVILPYFEKWLVVPANVYDSIMGTDYLDVNAAQLGGTNQAGRDIGTSVLLSNGTGTGQVSLDAGKVLLQATQTGVTIPTVTDITNAVKISAGTGAGQLDFTSGVVKANLTQILGTVLTETAGQIAAAFKKFFNIATPTGTVNSLPDAAPGANGGLPTTNGTKVNQTVDLTPGHGLALEATLTAIKGAGWTDETLVALMTAIEGISAGSGASVADILNALLASYTVSGSVGESLGRLDNIQAKTDLITTGTTITIASPVSGSTITAQRGDTLIAALENIGSLLNYSKLWFTVKRDGDDEDVDSLIQIEKTAGLKYIDGAVATTAANGSIAISDEPTGDITITLAAAEVAKLDTGSYVYDIQILRSSGTPVSTLTYGTFNVTADVTRATA